MAGMPPPADGAGRGRGMTLPSWMAGSNLSNSGAQSTANNVPGFGPPFLQHSNQQFRPGLGPPQGIVAGLGSPYPQFAQAPNHSLPSSIGFGQQQRPPPGVPPPSLPPNAVSVTPPSVAGVAPTFQFSSSAPFTQPGFGVSSGPYNTPAPSQLVQNVQPGTQAWPTIPGQPNSSVSSSSLQPGQFNISTLNSGTTGALTATPAVPAASDWQDHAAPDGRRYYYNKKTKVSSWEKPSELMTPTERADASTVWKEFTAADGRKYYYNKLTKQSKWTMPEEMKLAREKAEGTASPSPVQGLESGNTAGLPSVTSPSMPIAAGSSPAPVTTTNIAQAVHDAWTKPVEKASAALEISSPVVTTSSAISTDVTSPIVNAEPNSLIEKEEEPKEVVAEDMEPKSTSSPKSNVAAGEDNISHVDEDQPHFSNKTEAKTVFKELLEAKNVGSEWPWEQAMRAIINDKRYGVLKTSGERKQAFNEYVAQRRKQESEERRLKQKKAREEFVVMLQECKELTSTMRWSKAATLFAEDPRFIAVDKDRDRAELYEDYLQDLEKKEREKAREDRKRFLAEYKVFLESCDFIKASTQWRKVVDKLEDDERCSRLEKMDRLEIFQEHVKELEAKEEDEKRFQKEQQRRRERKNRDEFRRLLADDKASGVLNARTIWKDYVSKIKEDPAYEALCTNLTGSTPKDLFEDFWEDLDKRYQEDKIIAKEAIKAAKINVLSTWTFDVFKDALGDAGDLRTIDESNLKIVFEDLLDRAKEKEEKEAKKRKRLIDEFNELLHAEKSITATSSWEDCKMLLENAPEFRALVDDSCRRALFEDYVALLLQKAKEKEKKREEEKAKKEKEREREKEKEREREKRKEKERKEKEREKEKEKERERQIRKESQAHVETAEKEKERLARKERDSIADVVEKENEKEKERLLKKERENPTYMVEIVSGHLQKEERKKDKEKERDREKEKERERKHRKSRHSRSSDDASSEREDREEVKRSRKHSSEKRKSSRKHAYDSNSDSETRHKRHKKDRDIYRRISGPDELEDGELGEDGEIE